MSLCPHCGEDHDLDVQLGERVKLRVRKPLGAIVAVRMTRELVSRLDVRARSEGKTLSALIREAAESLLSPVPSTTVSASTAQTRTFYGSSKVETGVEK